MKHEAVQICESSLFYNQNNCTILANCNFKYSFNKTVIPSILDGGSNIVLANMVNSKRLTCSSTFNLGSPLPSYKYVTVSRTILCNCEIDAALSYVLRSIGSCTLNRETPKLQFTTNFKYLWQNLTLPPVFSEWEIIFPIHLNNSQHIIPKQAPQTMKELREFVTGNRPKIDIISHIIPSQKNTSQSTFRFIHNDPKKSNRAHSIFAYTITSLVMSWQ